MSRQPHLSQDNLERIADGNSSCFVIQLDTCEVSAIDHVLEWAHETSACVKTIAHAAGILGYDNVANITRDKMWDIVQPKVTHHHLSQYNMR